MRVDPCELTMLVTAVANALYGCLPAPELNVLAAVFDQLADTLDTLAAQAALRETRRGGSAQTEG